MKTTHKVTTLVATLIAFGSLAVGANAALVIGNIYLDDNNLQWTYIGDYDVGSGPSWGTNPSNYSAIEGATIVFGLPEDGLVYAISTSDTFVNHMAWYDGYGDGSHLPLSNSFGGGIPLAENFFSDAGAPGYNGPGDYSAYVGSDRATVGGGALNHVFLSVVPEPSSFFLLGLGALGIVVRRRRN